MATSSVKVAFFGATGDCAGFCLAAALRAGFDCVALARSQTKLRDSLQAKGVSSVIIEERLVIVQGDVRDARAVAEALHVNGRTVDVIVSGIGGTLQLQASLFQPAVINDATICRDAGQVILDALVELAPPHKPLLVSISTTGITNKGEPEDVPLLFRPLYHWFLAHPHADKKALEDKLHDHLQADESKRGIRGYINVKPSLLLDGEGKGSAAVRYGVEGLDDPAVGYTICRKDVGEWIFEKLLRRVPPDNWLNKGITLTT